MYWPTPTHTLTHKHQVVCKLRRGAIDEKQEYTVYHDFEKWVATLPRTDCVKHRPHHTCECRFSTHRFFHYLMASLLYPCATFALLRHAWGATWASPNDAYTLSMRCIQHRGLTPVCLRYQEVRLGTTVSNFGNCTRWKAENFECKDQDRPRRSGYIAEMV